MSQLDEFFDYKPDTPLQTNAFVDSFVLCPSIITAGLTPERITALRQIYRAAYAKTRNEMRRTTDKDDFNLGGGI
ncbi:MAG: hypothetical protein WC476_12230 [Phycisphaerae bacterium]|jgi:protein-disulfide isomerase-like protein with CxxC motif